MLCWFLLKCLQWCINFLKRCVRETLWGTIGLGWKRVKEHISHLGTNIWVWYAGAPGFWGMSSSCFSGHSKSSQSCNSVQVSQNSITGLLPPVSLWLYLTFLLPLKSLYTTTLLCSVGWWSLINKLKTSKCSMSMICNKIVQGAWLV